MKRNVKYGYKNPREDLKLSLLDTRRVVGKDGEIHQCEGQAMLEHTCAGGLHMNEVFVTRKQVMHIKPVSKRVRIYADERNCSIECQWFHFAHGHTRKWREFFRGVQEDRYSKMQEYLSQDWSKLKGGQA